MDTDSSQATSPKHPVSMTDIGSAVCAPSQGLTSHRHGLAAGAAGRRGVAEALETAAPEQPLFDFICSRSLAVDLCLSKGAGHELPSSTVCLWAETSFLSRDKSQWQCFFPPPLDCFDSSRDVAQGPLHLLHKVREKSLTLEGIREGQPSELIK